MEPDIKPTDKTNFHFTETRQDIYMSIFTENTCICLVSFIPNTFVTLFDCFARLFHVALEVKQSKKNI